MDRRATKLKGETTSRYLTWMMGERKSKTRRENEILMLPYARTLDSLSFTFVCAYQMTPTRHQYDTFTDGDTSSRELIRVENAR